MGEIVLDLIVLNLIIVQTKNDNISMLEYIHQADTIHKFFPKGKQTIKGEYFVVSFLIEGKSYVLFKIFSTWQCQLQSIDKKGNEGTEEGNEQTKCPGTYPTIHS